MMTLLNDDHGEIHFDKQLLYYIETKDNAKVRAILENEDVIRPRDFLEATLLHYAAQFGNAAIAKYLIDKGSNVEAQNAQKRTPLLLAVSNNQDDISAETVEVLLQANANMFTADYVGAYALQTVLYSKSFRVIEVTEMFLKKLATVCGNDDALIVEKLLAAECSLERAALLRKPSILRIMIARGCCVDERHPRLGHTALHAAVHLMDLENVKLLIEYGADVNAKDFKGRIPLFYYNHYCIRKIQQPEIIRRVVDEKTELTELDINGRHMQLTTVLIQGSAEAIRILLELGVDFSATTWQGKTALHYLASNTHPDVARQLENLQMDVNALDNLNNTPLFYAMYVKNVDMVQFLLENGAEVNVRNFAGLTPLYYLYAKNSCIKQHDRVVQLLFLYGGNCKLADTPRNTVFDIVKKRRKFDFVKTLLAHLAILHKLGQPPTSILLSSIASHKMFMTYFDSCLKKLDKMNNISINDTITTFTILAKPEEAIVKRCRFSPALLSKLISINKKSHSNFYYFGILQKRLNKIVPKVQMIQNAAFVLCKILGLSNNQIHLVVYTIINYLDYDDVQRLNRL